MVKTLRLDGKDYDVSVLSDQGQKAFVSYQHATQQLHQAENMTALLTKARNAYIADLKNEIIQAKRVWTSKLCSTTEPIKTDMPKVTIDDIEYNTEDLSDNGRAQLARLHFMEQHKARMKNEIDIYQSALTACARALKVELDSQTLSVVR